MSPLENQCTQNLERFVKIWMKNFSFRDFSFTKTKNLCVSLLQGFIILIADIRTIAPHPTPPEENCPLGQGWGFGKSYGQFQGWGATRQLSRRKFDPWLKLGFWLGLVLELGGNFLQGNCPRTLIANGGTNLQKIINFSKYSTKGIMTRSLLKIVRNISEQFQKHLEHFYEVRNSGVTKSSYETEFRKITSHFELLTRTFLQKFFFRAKVELT